VLDVRRRHVGGSGGSSRLGTGALLLLLVAVFVLLRSTLQTGIVDDTFIFLRYAENLASGAGPVFNPGERVEGYTSPLWVLLLGGLAFLGIDLVAAAPIASGLFGLATVLLLYREAQTRLSRRSAMLAAVPAWFLATNPSLVFWSWSGMETAAVTFLLTCSFLRFLRELEGNSRMTRSGLLYLVAVWTRPDVLAILPALALVVACVHRSHRSLLRRKLSSFLAPLLLLSVQFAWRYFYYGAFLPNTYQAKAAVASHVLLEAGIEYAAGFWAAYWFLLALIALQAGWILYRARALPAAWVATLAIFACWLVYTILIGGDHFAMFRFYVPILPLIAFAMVLMAEHWVASNARASATALVILCTLSVAAVSAVNYWTYASHGGTAARDEVELARRWSDVGRWLKRSVPPDSRIASIVVGAIPYYSGLKTYDLLGLTDRNVAVGGKTYAEAAVGHQRYNTDYILQERPDYIVVSNSGLYARPRVPLPPKTTYALIDLIQDPRTNEMYRYRAIRLRNGRYIELFELKKDG
jgi:hypothetical protein